MGKISVRPVEQHMLFEEFEKSKHYLGAIGTFLVEKLEKELDEKSDLRKLAKKDILSESALPAYDAHTACIITERRTVKTVKGGNRAVVHLPILDVQCECIWSIQHWAIKIDSVYENALKDLLRQENKLASIISKKARSRCELKFVLSVRTSLSVVFTSDEIDLRSMLKRPAKNDGFVFFEQIGVGAFGT